MPRQITHPGTGEIFDDRRESNDSSKIVWWMLTSVVALLTTTGLLWGNRVEGKILGYDNVMSLRGERLRAVESNYDALEQRLAAFESRTDSKLDRLDTKLQTVLDRMVRRQ